MHVTVTYTSFFVFLMAVCVFSQRCPPEGVIAPCFCTLRPIPSTITCSNFTDTVDLLAVFRRTEAWPFYSFTLQDSDVMFLPSAAFSTKNFTKIQIVNTTLTSLFDEPTPYDDRLDQLILSKVRLQRGIQWEYLKNLDRLSYLQIESVYVRKLDRIFKESVSRSIVIIKMSRTKTTSLEDTAFQRLTELRTLSIRHAEISSLKRSMFPRTCRLDTLDLTGNHLQSLQPDLFENMPLLQRVHLSENRLTTFSKDVFAEIYNRKEHFINLFDNPLVCDCNIRWYLTESKNGWILGTCSKDEDKKGKSLSDLTEADFAVCAN